MSDLTNWVKGLIAIVVLWSFVELLLPSADMKRYIRFAVGLIIMLTIIRPILNVKDIKFNDLNLPTQTEFSTNATNEQIEMVYKNKLENELISKFNLGYVKIFINKDKQITKVELDELSKREQIARHLGLTTEKIVLRGD